MPSKYDPLGEFLRNTRENELRLSLDEISQMIGKLPKSAKTHQFWANVKAHSIERRGQWLNAGFQAFFDAASQTVRFERDTQKSGFTSAVWSREELLACVKAYHLLWSGQQIGEQINKSKLRLKILEENLAGRSASAYEKRMQNISAVMNELGIEWVQGYAPLPNIGTAKATIIELINDVWQRSAEIEAPTSDPDKLSTRIVAARIKASTGGEPPSGRKTVFRKERPTAQFERDPNVIAWVEIHANGVCELCEKPAPFLRKDGSPFLEVHHVRPLAEGGPDIVENAAALCPNCHRMLHHAQQKESHRRRLISKNHRLKNFPKKRIEQ